MPASILPTSPPSLKSRAAALAGDARILASLVRGLPRNASHADALAGFYGPQADRYDDFRDRLLQGRREMIHSLPCGAGDRIVELGGGTGRTLEFFEDRLATFASVDVVDLCAPLLNVAGARAVTRPNVRLVHRDAVAYRPAAPVDAVCLSYALTMMPRWEGVIENALRMLRPGGAIGVVDFYVSPPEPPAGRIRHGLLTRTLWPAWFRHDGVHLNGEHLDRLQEQFETVQLAECRARIPYLPLVTVPYYIFIGRKR